MPSRIGSYRPWLWSAVAVVLSAAPAAAQPPSPLELARGLREHGMTELALEYLKEIESKPLPADDKAAIPLERAKCLLEASEDEPDEGTRLGMVAEAKEGLNAFLINSPNHPRAVEGMLAVAKLTALDAREQLNRARRMEIPPPGESPEENAAREKAQDHQKGEAAKARPLFLLASKRYAEASEKLRAKLGDAALDPVAKRNLEREANEAELASGINQFNTAETYMPASRITGAEKAERNKFLEAAKETFGKLDKGANANRTVWVARAWIAEVTYEQDDFNTAAQQVTAILKSNLVEAEDGKRLARFFQLRRNFLSALGERNLAKVQASEQELRAWLRTYGNPRKPTPEVFAVRYYLGRVLQSQAESSIGPRPKGDKPVVVGASARAWLTEAERIYRGLAQSDHDFTARASRQRMAVVRLLLGDADAPPAAYDTFEKAQMAALIVMSRLAQEDAKEKKDEKKVQGLRQSAIALLERARELATPADNQADVTDALLRLILFYQLSDQPYQAAVLGEHVAHTVKSTGGKAALAGLLSLNGYIIASRRVKGEDPETLRADRKADRARAVALARFLDEKYPNDHATDSARYQLASMLVEDKQFPEAFDVVTKVRPGFAQIGGVRLLEGYLAQQLIGRESPLPEDKKVEVFRRAVADLVKTPKPASVALETEVRNYLSVRCRLASLLFLQRYADPKAEAANPGYNQALTIAQEAINLVPTYDHMVKAEGGMKKLNLDGLEMNMLAQEVYARAVYLRSRALMDAADKVPAAERPAKLEEAVKSLEPMIEAVKAGGPALTPEIKGWAGAGGDGDNPEAVKEAAHKARIADLAGKVDKTRVDVILAGFRARVKQGKAPEAEALLDLMVKTSGGGVEDCLPLLEPVGRELAAHMAAYRKEGREAEAKALGAGLAALLKKIKTVPNLTLQMRLFVGQTLQSVGENEEAIKTLESIKPPEFPGWESKPLEEFPAELRGKIRDQIQAYSVAQLTIARALRDGKKFAEAEKKLTEIVGTNDKHGWGYARLYFRRELAMVHEDRGAAIANPKDATAEWGKAKQTWEQLVGIHSNRLRNPGKDATPEDLKKYKLAYADAYFDVQRCLVKANQQLVKDPAKLQTFYETVAKRFLDMEKLIPAPDWTPEVQHQYADLLRLTPPLMALYKNGGGKVFLEKMPVP
jgi:hypothetical protein